MYAPPLTSFWNASELEALDQARGKLRRSVRVNSVLGVLGFAATFASFILPPSGGRLFWLFMLVCPLRPMNAQRKQQRLEALAPGTPLSAQVLGVRTRIDPPDPKRQRTIQVLAGAIFLVFVFIVLAFSLG